MIYITLYAEWPCKDTFNYRYCFIINKFLYWCHLNNYFRS